MTAQAKEAESVVSELTDKVIAAEIRKIDRIIQTQRKHVDEAALIIKGYEAQRAVLVQAQITRLRAQLPQEQVND